jgi:hypothetical protein
MTETTIYNWVNQEKIDRGEIVGQTTDQRLDTRCGERGQAPDAPGSTPRQDTRRTRAAHRATPPRTHPRNPHKHPHRTPTPSPRRLRRTITRIKPLPTSTTPPGAPVAPARSPRPRARKSDIPHGLLKTVSRWTNQAPGL